MAANRKSYGALGLRFFGFPYTSTNPISLRVKRPTYHIVVQQDGFFGSIPTWHAHRSSFLIQHESQVYRASFFSRFDDICMLTSPIPTTFSIFSHSVVRSSNHTARSSAHILARQDHRICLKSTQLTHYHFAPPRR